MVEVLSQRQVSSKDLACCQTFHVNEKNNRSVSQINLTYSGCSPGYFVENNICVQCPRGTYSDSDNQNWCYDCRRGFTTSTTYGGTSRSDCNKERKIFNILEICWNTKNDFGCSVEHLLENEL